MVVSNLNPKQIYSLNVGTKIDNISMQSLSNSDWIKKRQGVFLQH